MSKQQPTKEDISFALYVKEILVRKKLSIYATARIMGCGQPFLSRVLNGKNAATLNTWRKLAAAIGCELKISLVTRRAK